MKKLILSLSLFGSVFASSAQELPAPSPLGKVEQRVGLTDITIEYSRPGVKDRVVFGNLVPYGEMWRTGANMNTTIEFSTPVTIQGATLEAGKYSIFTIPQPDMWMVIFNRKTDHPGTYGYSDANDMLRAEAKVIKVENKVETFTMGIDDINEESANISFTWENIKVILPFKVDVFPIAKNNIEEALKTTEDVDKWKVYRKAASYYHDSKIDSDKALEYINLSIEGNDESWYSYWLKGEILADKGEYKDAVKAAKKAKKVGEDAAKNEGSEFNYGSMIEADITKWSAMK